MQLDKEIVIEYPALPVEGILMTLHALSKNYIMIASLTVFYSLIIVLAVTIPFRAALEKRLIEVDKS